ncbi:S41 family peptidase [Acidobacteriota bacterium]
MALISFSSEDTRVLRFPAIHGDQIVFTFAGDLYSVSTSGGTARKLTSHEGFEAFARFSPDGKHIAFTGQYDGNREVYMMPREGGLPKRITYTATLGRDDISDRMGPNNIVMGWTNDNENIVFRSRWREWNAFNGQLYLTSVNGGIPQQIPLPRGGFCSFSPDGKKLAYNRIFREFRTWKRYRGGMADDVWIYDFTSKQIANITNNPAQDIIPMWSGPNIYFLSDRDENKKMNLHVYNLDSKETRALTDFAEFDIKFPSIGPKAIVFENGGYIYRFDIEREEAKKIPILVADDLQSSRSKIVNVSARVSNYEISPDGKRALFGARGDVFTVPAKHGNIRNLTASSGVHDRNSKWSPDGRWIAFISDKTGEDEIYIISQDGKGEPTQLTSGADTYKYQIYWSPDSKKILWGDKLLRLNYVDVATKKTVVVAKAKAWEIRDYAWSPDSNWITYSQQEVDSMTKVYLYNLVSQKTHEVTDGWYSSYSPSFHSEGKYLFFVSDRDFDPIYSSTEWNHAFGAQAKIYFVTLTKDVKSPFEPKSDEVKIEEKNTKEEAEPKKKDKKEQNKKAEDKKSGVKVDPDGLKGRILALPVDVANYWALASVGDSLYYMKRGDRERSPKLMIYDLKEQKETDLGNIDGFEISHDKKKMLVSQSRAYAIINLPKGPIQIKDKLDLSDMQVKVDVRAEWSQIFEESWRQLKYFFYAPNMHGVDWDAMKTRYKPLADSVRHRADLTYVIGEMIGELNVGHTYVGGGDFPRPERVNTGMLGARFAKDPNTGYFKIKKILIGQNWDPTLRSPLTEIGVKASEGNYILGVNGMSCAQLVDIYQGLQNTVGKQVTLKVNSVPEEQGSWETVVIPIQDELNLYYYNWVWGNIDKVSKATGGKVGYVHVPNMGRDGLIAFVKQYYPQLRKKALIIDVRSNGGGNVSPMLIERLQRDIAMVDIARNGVPATDPGEILWGPKVCLMDEFSASDGDIFPYRFRKYKLGKLIGKRTWGGVVGIRGPLPSLDGGQLFKPEFANYSVDGKWIIEGIGVEPDIYVDNDPAKEYAGIDEQLKKAIEVILEELKTKEKELPPVPPYPKKKK